MDLEIQAFRADRNRTDDLDPSFTVYRALGVEGWCTGYRTGGRTCDEVKDILVCLFEGEVDGEGWEGGELGVEFV